MKSFLLSLLILCIGLVQMATKVAALPSSGVESLTSPDHRFEVALSDNHDSGSSPWSAPYWLTITDSGRQLARYPFDGQMVSGYWSPGGKYLAVNNHFGHCFWTVWIISLRTGDVCTAHGKVHGFNYHADEDENGLPNISRIAAETLRSLTPGVDDYARRAGPVSVAYG